MHNPTNAIAPASLGASPRESALTGLPRQSLSQTGIERTGSPPIGSLPSRLRCLFVCASPTLAARLREALAADSAIRVDLQAVTSGAAAIERLADQAFDAVLVRHDPGTFDALDWIEALRAGGADEPVVVWGNQSDAELAPACYEVDADAYVSDSGGAVRGLLWLLARAIERRSLRRENSRFESAEAQRLEQEQREAERLMVEQGRLAGMSGGGATEAEEATDAALVDSLKQHYRELLRTHVIMGSGGLEHELASLADALATTAASPRAVWRLHAQMLGELVRGLGNRSARQMIARADLLAIDLLLRLTERYRRGCLGR